MKEKHFQTCIEELDSGDFETVPADVYDAYYTLNYQDKLRVFKKTINYQLKNQPKYVLLSDD